MTDVGGFFDKRIIGALNAHLARKHLHDPDAIPPAVHSILEEKPDLIVFTGDAASCGQPPEFRLALEALKPLTESGIPILCTPGNHDLYVRNKTCRAACDDFIRRLTNGRMDLEHYPETFDTEALRFLIFNAARPTNPVLSCGFFDESSNELLKKECAQKTKPLVAVCHFPFRRIRKGLVNGLRHRMFHARAAIEAINGGELDLALCGHIHVPYFDLDSTGRGETSCGSLTRFRAYSVIEFDGRNFLHRRVEI